VIVNLVDILLVCIVLAAFAFGLRTGIGTLIVMRPLTDRLFDLAGIEVAGNHVTYGILLNIIVVCTAMINIVRIRRSTPTGLRNIWLPFLFVCAIAVLYSPLPFDAVRRLFVYVCYFSIFGLAFVVVKSERDVLFFLKLVVLSSLLPVLYGLFQTFSGSGWFDDSRIQSTFSHPNMLAFYLLAVIGIILFLSATERARITGRLRLFLNLYLIPILIVLIMTKTRSAWIGCFALFLGYGLAYDRRVLVPVLIAATLTFAIPVVSERIFELTSQNDYIGESAVTLNSYAWRKLLWADALTYIWQQPILGYGLHSFPFYSAEFFSPAPGAYAHNDFIEVLFETGLVGLTAFLWIFVRCFAWLIPRRRFDSGGFITAATIMAAYLICSYSDNLMEYLPYQWEFWFPFGVICWHMERHRARARDLASISELVRIDGNEEPSSGGRVEPRCGAENLGRLA
jgi:putative inorganic carbon (hco3(-)) transporter